MAAILSWPRAVCQGFHIRKLPRVPANYDAGHVAFVCCQRYFRCSYIIITLSPFLYLPGKRHVQVGWHRLQVLKEVPRTILRNIAWGRTHCYLRSLIVCHWEVRAFSGENEKQKLYTWIVVKYCGVVSCNVQNHLTGWCLSLLEHSVQRHFHTEFLDLKQLPASPQTKYILRRCTGVWLVQCHRAG